MATITTRDGRVYVRLAEIPMNDGKFKYGREYELDKDFKSLEYPEFFDDEDGKLHYLSYAQCVFRPDPLMLETGEYMDEVIVYREV